MARPFARTFYDSKLWKQQRRHALDRDRYSCRDCGARAEEVHHIVELSPSNIADYNITLSLSNLVSLCHECHNKRHGDSASVPDGFVFDEGGQVVPG